MVETVLSVSGGRSMCREVGLMEVTVVGVEAWCW
jgi:hypothetical protein